MSLRRQFHGWDEPALPVALRLLCDRWMKEGCRGPLDLRNTLLLVPTRQAGRRLRAELAKAAARQHSAVLTGLITTPEHVPPLPPDAAGEPTTLTLLARLLLEKQPHLSALFPSTGIPWSLPFALSVAGQLQDIRMLLTAADRRIEDLLPLVPDIEKDRWVEMAGLEQALLEQSGALGMPDALHLRREAARRACPWPTAIHIHSLFIPDLPPLAAQALQTWSADHEIEIHILAPEAEANRFDEWGRALPERWEEEHLPISEEQILVSEQAPDETDQLARLLSIASNNKQAVTFCMPDPDRARALALQLQSTGRSLYLPNGVRLSDTAPGNFFAAWLTWRRQPSYAATAALLRHPDTQEWLCHVLQRPDAAGAFLSELDRCQAEHLPAEFQDLLQAARSHDNRFPTLLQALETLQQHMEEDELDFLARVYDCRPPAAESGLPPDPLFAPAAEAISELVQRIQACGVSLHLSAEDRRDVLAALLQRTRIFPAPNDRDIREASGWLETQWESSSSLLLADMREGVVPETRFGDAFLPDALRIRAGLPANRERFARDLYLTRALLAAHPSKRIRFFFSRRSASQEPQLPSRILLACSDAELPGRIFHLFERAIPDGKDRRPVMPLLKLHPPEVVPEQIPTALSVTALKHYLQCPFRFYLRHILHMEPQDDHARELDVRSFGTLAHEALRALKAVPDLENENAVANLLLSSLESMVKAEFGAHPSLALHVQLASLQQRLRAAAKQHVQAVREGWRLLDSEQELTLPFAGTDGTPVTLHARIDRVERHADGRIRILDYKTSDSGANPNKTHFQPRTGKWLDLQLPLYRFLYESLHPEAGPVSVGYFNLPKAVAQTHLAEFNFASAAGIPDLYPLAIVEARRVIQSILNGLFWPPASLIRDDFSFLCLADSSLIDPMPPPHTAEGPP
ncbi:MAG: PD-(D/E)XK nuclease family protein [Verrucomicrobiota bacterium]|nr:PD-(D/E)XK nuclease family protein [Verrucomicrobiota bacterium]